MIKLITTSEKTLKFILKNKILRRFFVFRIDYLAIIQDSSLYNIAQSLFVLNNSSKKTTYCGRFKDIDSVSVDMMKINEENIIHDIAASVGSTSLELYNKIEDKGMKTKFFISDKYSRFFIYKNLFFTKVFDADYNLLHYYFLCFFADKKLNIGGILSKLLFYFIKLIDFSDTDNTKYKEILLYDKRVLNLMDNNKLVHLDYDVLNSEIENKFTFVRAMNIVNGNIFSPAEMKLALANIKKSLKENGILQIGITEGEINRVSFFKLNSNNFYRIKDMNQGYPDKCNLFLD